MNIKLTPELRIALELRHSKVLNGYERDRIKAILLNDKGYTIVMIAQALLVHESTISRHLKDFIAEQNLTPENYH
jgi:predicted ArsR family transcriptional regulator